MRRELIDPPTLFQSSLDLAWDTPRLVEELITRLKADPDFRGYRLERVAQAFPAEELEDGERDFRPTHSLRSYDDSTADESIHRRILYLSDTSLSYIVETPPFPRWKEQHQPELKRLVEFLFREVTSCRLSDLKLRFVNAFTKDHRVTSVADLDVDVRVGGHKAENLALTYVYEDGRCAATVRIASGSLVTGVPVDGVTVLADLEIVALDASALAGPADVVGWIEEAHALAFKLYKSLFTPEMSKFLVRQIND